MRRVVAVEIEAAFADGDDPGVSGQFPYRLDRCGVAIARMMGMHSGSGVKTQLQCLPAFLDRRAGDDDRAYSGIARALQNLWKIVAERGVRQVRADVDHRKTTDKQGQTTFLILARTEKRGLSLIRVSSGGKAARALRAARARPG